jgi:hypothetical protein
MQGRLERHAAGHDEGGRRDIATRAPVERAEAAAAAEKGEAEHGSAPQVREPLGDLVGVWRLEHPGDPPVGEHDDAVGVRRRTGSWVTMTTVWPSASTTSRRSASTPRPVRESSAPVGSSAKTTSGRVTSARAIATRCCWPPESWDGTVAQAVLQPDPRRDLADLGAPRAAPARRSGRPMFWLTVSDGIRLNAWKTKPIRSRRRIVSRRSLRPASSVSPSATAPEVGRSSPAATCSSVLLPDPTAP